MLHIEGPVTDKAGSLIAADTFLMKFRTAMLTLELIVVIFLFKTKLEKKN